MPEPFNVLLLIHIWLLIWRTILMLFKDSLLRSTFTLYFLFFFLMCVCVCGLLHYVILLRIFFYQTFSWGDINFFSYRADMILEEWVIIVLVFLVTHKKAKPSLVLLGHCLPSHLNFWPHSSQRCIAFSGRTSSNHAFSFVFKTLMSKNRENKWSMSKLWYLFPVPTWYVGQASTYLLMPF